MKIPGIVNVLSRLYIRYPIYTEIKEAIEILKKVYKLEVPKEKKIDKNRSADDRRYPIGYNACLKQWKAQIDKLKEGK